MNIDEEIGTVARQAWHTSSRPEDWDELEAYLRKHTLNGAMREAHDAWVALWSVIVRDVVRAWLRVLDMLGI